MTDVRCRMTFQSLQDLEASERFESIIEIED